MADSGAPLPAIPPARDILSVFVEETTANPNVVASAFGGEADYYHYGVDGFPDIGWGCAYRAVMIVGSHLAKRVERLRDVPIPTIPSIQATLAAHGRDDAPHSGFTAEHIGSSRWIEPWEGAKILRGAPFHVPCLSDQIASTSFADVGRLLQLFWAYFREQRAPVMIDDSIMAYAVQGIRRLYKPLRLPSPRASAEETGAELQTKAAGDLDPDALARALAPAAEAGAVGAPWADDGIVRLLARAEAAGTLEAITPADIAHTEILLWDTHATGDVQRRDFEFRCGWGAGWVNAAAFFARARSHRWMVMAPLVELPAE